MKFNFTPAIFLYLALQGLLSDSSKFSICSMFLWAVSLLVDIFNNLYFYTSITELKIFKRNNKDCIMQKIRFQLHWNTPFPSRNKHLTFIGLIRDVAKSISITHLRKFPKEEKETKLHALTLPPPLMPSSSRLWCSLQSSAGYVITNTRNRIVVVCRAGVRTHTAALYHCRTRSLTHSTHPSARHGRSFSGNNNFRQPKAPEYSRSGNRTTTPFIPYRWSVYVSTDFIPCRKQESAEKPEENDEKLRNSSS